MPILVLTMHGEQQYAVQAIKAGAAGYLTKDCAAAQLEQAVRKVAAGGRYRAPRSPKASPSNGTETATPSRICCCPTANPPCSGTWPAG